MGRSQYGPPQCGPSDPPAPLSCVLSRPPLSFFPLPDLTNSSHKLTLDLEDGLPALVDYPFKGSPLAAWLLENHTVHHDARGIGNFNIVFPLFDHVMGVYYYRQAKPR